MSVMLKISGQPWRCPCGANVLTDNADGSYTCNGCRHTYVSERYVGPDPMPALTDHTAEIIRAAREYVRGIREWESGVHPYPAEADDALIAAVNAEQDAQAIKEGEQS